MANYNDLKAQYKLFNEVNLVSRLDEIKTHSLGKIRGTLVGCEQNDGHQRTWGTYGSEVFRAKIVVGITSKETGEYTEAAASYTGQNGRSRFNAFNTFLGGIGEEDEIEVLTCIGSQSKVSPS